MSVLWCLCVLGGERRGLVADWHCLLQEKRPTVTGTHTHTHTLQLTPRIDPSRPYPIVVVLVG